MNIHEHQAKEILKSFGAPVAKGVAIFSIDEAETAIANPAWASLCGKKPNSCRRAR